MKKIIDCLLIGHNEMNFQEYEKTIRKMGVHSGAYRDLNLNFIWYNNTPYSVSDIFNALTGSNNNSFASSLEPLNMGETFSAAIAYLGTYLNRRGFTFDYVNSFRDNKQELLEKFEQYDILTTAITTTLYVSAFPIIEIVDFIKKYNQTTRIIVGGPFVSTQIRTQDPISVEYLFKNTIGADFYINSSQGEATLVKLINAVKHNIPPDNVNNICFESNQGFFFTPISKENNKLSENMVNWDLFADRVGEYAALRTSISCPFSCAFCGFPQHAGEYQTAKSDLIETELNQLDKPGTVKYIHFIDDTFNVPQKRFKEILGMMVRNRYKFKWHSYFRCQFADRETVELMKASGCEGVFLGIESGSNHILEKMNKAADVEKYREGIALLKEYDIMTFGNFIIGFPGETHQTVEETVKFIQESHLDFFRVQLWYCEPITPIWKERDKYNIKGNSFEWSHAAMDSQLACDLIENIFLSIEDPVWMPQYNFDFDTYWHLIHRGMSPAQTKTFLKQFRNAIKEKIITPSQKEVSYHGIKQLKRSISGPYNGNEGSGDKPPAINDSQVEFDF